MIKKYTFLGIYEKVMSYQALNLVIQIRLLGDFSLRPYKRMQSR